MAAYPGAASKAARKDSARMASREARPEFSRFAILPCKVGTKTSYNSIYRGFNPSYPFIRPFVGITTPFITVVGGPPCIDIQANTSSGLGVVVIFGVQSYRTSVD